MKKNSESQYSSEETEQRLRAIMRGAAHRPTPLKDIPTRAGESRKIAKKKSRASAASVKSARPAP